jgi:hypothetical protein
MKYLALFLALVVAAGPATGLAQRTGAHRPAGGAARPGGGGGGFNFNRDTAPQRQAPQRPPQQQYNRPNTNNVNNHPTNNNYNRNVNVNNHPANTNYNRNVNVNNRSVNVANVNVNRNVVVNPVYRGGPAWGWNHGVAWYPAPAYWGGGFWGAMAIGVTSAAVYGAIMANNVRYASYQIQPNSPGATLLNNYQLTQTPCGPPNLVVIFGPNNSVICAYPNNIVSPGNYNLDPSTLTLTSQ